MELESVQDIGCVMLDKEFLMLDSRSPVVNFKYLRKPLTANCIL
jgi:hypothetical protein